MKERGPVLSAERGELVDIQIQGDDGEIEEGLLEMKGIAGEATGFDLRYMTEEEWWSEPWEVRAAELSVWVRENKLEPEEID